MTTQHTPTPWLLSHDTNDIRDRNDRMIVNGQSIHGHAIKDGAYSSGAVLYAKDDGGNANAAFIIRACNSHDDLLNAAVNAVNTINRLHPQGRPYNDFNLVYQELKYAIAKAKGD